MATTADVFADALRLRWVSRLNNISIPNHQSVSNWLERGAFNWIPTSIRGSALIDLRGCEDAFANALAAEISRFSCGAYESLLDSSPPVTTPKSLAWPMIRHYYAAFYCGHAILRIGGQALTYLSANTIITLNKVAAQYLGVSPGLSSGLHLVGPTPNDPTQVRIVFISKGGGSHEDMWKYLMGFVVELENSILKTQGESPRARAAVDKSILLRAHLCQAGKNNGGWLSSVRNSINYRHDYGIWFPYSVEKNFSQEMSRRMKRWLTNDASCFSIVDDQGDLGQLVDISNFLARVLLVSLQDIANRSPFPSRSFVNRQTFSMLRQRQISVSP